MNLDTRPVLLFSGGLDSFAAWRLLRHPRTVYFALGHRYQDRELSAIRKLTDLSQHLPNHLDVEIVDRLRLGDLEEQDGFIPLRNLLLAACGSLELTGGSRVYLGGLRGESSRDKSKRFFRDGSRLLSFLANRPIVISAPLRHMTKTHLVGEYCRHFPNEKDLLLSTRSCYSDQVLTSPLVGCGRCMACFRRWVAMTNNGIQEDYLEPPYTWSVVQQRNWPTWWANLRKAPLAEWVGILNNNLDAWRAMKRVHHL